MRHPRARIAALAVVLVLAGCSEKVSIGGPDLTSTPTPTRTTPRPSKRTSARPTPTPTPATDGTGILAVVVEDEKTRYRRSQIPITYRGPRSGTMLTDAEGVAKIRLPAGTYKIQVKTGCHDAVEVFNGTGGTAGIAEGDKAAIAVLKVKARLRYWGGTPLQSTPSPPWPAGEIISLRYRLFDRCRDVEAPGKTTKVTYRTDANLEVIGTPARVADRESDILMRVRCKEPGFAQLFIVDAETEEETDLLSLQPASAMDPGAKWCGGPA